MLAAFKGMLAASDMLLDHAGAVCASLISIPLLLHVTSLAAAHGCGCCGIRPCTVALTHARLRCGYSGQTSSSSATLITNMCARQRPWCTFLLWDCLLLAKGKVPTSGSCSPCSRGSRESHGCSASQPAAARPVSDCATRHYAHSVHGVKLCFQNLVLHIRHAKRQDSCYSVPAYQTHCCQLNTAQGKLSTAASARCAS
jgi:hypothetical protein